MPWGRVDDDFYDHPKVKHMPAEIRNAACGLYWRAVSYSNRYLTDGCLSDMALAGLDATPEELAALVSVAPGFRFGLFEKRRTGFRVHDFLEHNKSRKEVEAERIKKTEAGRLGGLARARNQAEPKHSASDVPAQAEPKQGAKPLLSKTQAPGASPRPDPTESESSTPRALTAVGRSAAGESNGPRLTRAQLAAWATFDDPAWQPFKAAWLSRGFRLPPFGTPGDDPDSSQRARLWRIADDQPQTLGQWVREAKGKTAHEVIAYVFARRAETAAKAGDDWIAEP